MSKGFHNCGSADHLLRALFYSAAPANQTTVLILLCGLPGAGKTALADRICQLHRCLRSNLGSFFLSDRCVHVEFDQIHGSDFASIRSQAFDQVRNELLRGGIIIADDNQFYKSMRKEYIRLAKTLDAACLIVFLDVPLEVALQRNRTRRVGARLDEDVITRMAARFDQPQDDALRIDGLASLNGSANFVLDLALKSLPPQNLPVPLPPVNLPNAKALAEEARKEKVRQAILRAQEEGITGRELNEVALKLRSTGTGLVN